MILTRPVRTASSAGSTILAVSTNHWSVSIGSITTFDRSPKGCMIGFASTSGGHQARCSAPVSGSTDFLQGRHRQPLGGDRLDHALARLNRSSPRSIVGHKVQASTSASVKGRPGVAPWPSQRGDMAAASA
jgi:hypothetical protein